MSHFTVKFKPQNKSIKVAQGTDLLSAAIKCGIKMTVSCGGEGICGKCRIGYRLQETGSRIKGKFIEALACQTLVESDLEVDIPKESIEVHHALSHSAEDFTKGVVLKRESAFKFSPVVKKICKLEGGSRVTVITAYKDGVDSILAIEPGDTAGKLYGFAFDIGTTTVVGQLLDLNTKEILGTRIAFNKQASFGSDVITRIICASEPDGLKKLNEAVLDNINEIIKDLTGSCKVDLGDIYAVIFAGNMTMMHLLLSIDPSNIRKAPYIPAASTFPAVHASKIGVGINPKGLASFLPGVSTYIGGDIVAGVVACGLSESQILSLLVDIGTNGEIVLGNKDWMIGAAASAGPAFEGSGLEFGMKATAGAIQKISIDGGLGVKFDVIGSSRAKGICGSGYIDLLCQMLKRGIIGKDGKIDRAKKSNRIRKGENVYEFVVAFKSETSIGKDIVINEDDIDNLKRSKGAIYSAIISLVNKVEKRIADVKKIYIAGGFGNYLNIENTIYIGLLPDLERGIYEFIGNSSLAGARMALLSRDALKYANDIYRNITYLDLSSEPNYMDEYIGALFFPHTDIGRFPSVRL